MNNWMAIAMLLLCGCGSTVVPDTQTARCPVHAPRHQESPPPKDMKRHVIRFQLEVGFARLSDRELTIAESGALAMISLVRDSERCLPGGVAEHLEGDISLSRYCWANKSAFEHFRTAMNHRERAVRLGYTDDEPVEIQRLLELHVKSPHNRDAFCSALGREIKRWFHVVPREEEERSTSDASVRYAVALDTGGTRNRYQRLD